MGVLRELRINSGMHSISTVQQLKRENMLLFSGHPRQCAAFPPITNQRFISLFSKSKFTFEKSLSILPITFRQQQPSKYCFIWSASLTHVPQQLPLRPQRFSIHLLVISEEVYSRFIPQV